MTREVELSFLIQPLEDDGGVLSLIPVLSGAPLTHMVSQFEREHDFEPSGDYGGLVPDWFKYGPLDEYFMGESKDSYWKKGYYLLACKCGDVGCWPLQARITQSGDTIVWDSFRQPHRSQWNYSDLGPFVFDRERYKAAVLDAIARLQGRP